MNNKRAVRLKYYEGIRQATLDHIKATEDGVRKLEGVKPAKIEKLMADVHKKHEKLLERIDRLIKHETRDSDD
jgi:hypothetical protein